MSPGIRQPPACPQCGSRESHRITLSQPRPDLPKRERRPGGILGTLGLGVDNPDRVCRRCGHQWRSKSRISND